MKTNPFFRYRSDTAPPRHEQRSTGLSDAHALTRKAVERWENEGGKIPDLYTAQGRDASVRSLGR